MNKQEKDKWAFFIVSLGCFIIVMAPHSNALFLNIGVGIVAIIIGIYYLTRKRG